LHEKSREPEQIRKPEQGGNHMTTLASAIEFKEIHLRTGVRLRYAETGPRNGPPLLLLHGYSDSWFSFSPVLGLMPADLRLIIPDQRGHGDSERPLEGYRPQDFAADALAMLQALGIESATVVGHSMGSFVAQRMATLAPKQVSRLVLVGSAATADNEVVRSLIPAVHSLTDPVDIAFVREFQMSTIYRPVPPAFLDRVIAESLKLPARVWKAVLAGLLDLPTLTDAPAIRCPASIFWGDRDAIFGREDQDELMRRIPGATLHVFNFVGHDPHWEAPEDFVRHLAAAIQK
jgi:pimeloyl-ACP methyl ester carboxylesterase